MLNFQQLNCFQFIIIIQVSDSLAKKNSTARAKNSFKFQMFENFCIQRSVKKYIFKWIVDMNRRLLWLFVNFQLDLQKEL